MTIDVNDATSSGLALICRIVSASHEFHPLRQAMAKKIEIVDNAAPGRFAEP